MLGKAASWAIPFIRTPTNVGKFLVESTPLGITKGKKGVSEKEQYLHEDQIGRAMFGSIVTALGGLAAWQGNTTWSPPKDPALKELWYATGRKPYSVKIGNRWVPMWYFGPYAAALAIPAAVADVARDKPDALSEEYIRKLVNISEGMVGYIGSQTSVSGAANFIEAMQGKESASLEKAAAFTAGQAIPASGLVRWTNTIIDPYYRKARTFEETFKRDIPYYSQQLEAYLDPYKRPVKRNISDWLLPYTIGKVDPEFERRYQLVKTYKQRQNLANEQKKEYEKKYSTR